MRAHGLLGAIEVRLDWPGSRGLGSVPRVLLEAPDGQRTCRTVSATRPTAKGVLLSLEGVVDRDAAEALRGHTVWVERNALPELAPGEYYLSDLIGFQVLVDEREIGHVVGVQVYPSVDAVTIEGAGGEHWEQPIVDQWVARVDLAARSLVLSSEDGLIEVPARSRANRPDRPAKG